MRLFEFFDYCSESWFLFSLVLILELIALGAVIYSCVEAIRIYKKK